ESSKWTTAVSDAGSAETSDGTNDSAIGHARGWTRGADGFGTLHHVGPPGAADAPKWAGAELQHEHRDRADVRNHRPAPGADPRRACDSTRRSTAFTSTDSTV